MFETLEMEPPCVPRFVGTLRIFCSEHFSIFFLLFLQSYKHGDPSHGKITSPKLIKSETFFYYNISNLDINSNFICFEKHVKI